MERKLVKFIKKHRANGVPEFKILTTSNEIIVVVQQEGYESDQIRFKYK